MARAKSNGTGYIDAAECVRLLRAFIREAEDEDTVSVGELRQTLNRVIIPGELGSDELASFIVDRLRAFRENNPGESGMASSSIWRELMAQGRSLYIEQIDDSLMELEGRGKVERIPGFITLWALAMEEEEKTA